jgi:hypothetical protein
LDWSGLLRLFLESEYIMSSSSSSPHVGTGPTFADWIFILVVAGALALVAYLGEIAFEHAQQTEKSKRNGEALATWLGQASAERFKPDYAIKACAGGGDAKSSPWGACLEHLLAHDFKGMQNPFKGKTPEFIEQCNPADKSLTGEIVLLKVTATPPGSAVPTINSKLAAEDSIDQKLQLSIGICDKGSYLVKVSDVEF